LIGKSRKQMAERPIQGGAKGRQRLPTLQRPRLRQPDETAFGPIRTGSEKVAAVGSETKKLNRDPRTEFRDWTSGW
jgi:hypothetical protein